MQSKDYRKQRSNPITRRKFLAQAGMGAAGAYLAMQGIPGATAEKKRPNFVFIITDDQRFDAMSCMGHPYLRTPNMDRLAKEGVRFSNAMVTTSICSPSRGSFLTGKYVHTHGVLDNRSFFPTGEHKNFAEYLQKAGYDTAYFGKWHMFNQDVPQPGFNHWCALLGQGTYLDPSLNVNGTRSSHPGYVTDVLTKYASDWLKQKREGPFCLYLGHKACHDPRTPAVRHEKIYADAEYPLPASSKYHLEGKPQWLKNRIPLAKKDFTFPGNPESWQEGVRNYHRTLASVDDSIGTIYRTLEAMGELDNTVFIFTSDNGYFFGEHGLGDKRKAYEEALRIPFLVRFPRMVKPGVVNDEMILNIDLAPTLLDLAGVPVPSDMQGKSFKPLLEGKKANHRDDFLYEYFVDREYPLNTPKTQAVRTRRWKYITYPEISDIDELYDLKNDPCEMKNLSQDPMYAGVVKEMKARLERLLSETGGKGI